MYTLLLVEDDPAIREIVAMVLSDAFAGCIIHQAATGHAFFALLQQGKHDIVLLDVQLPDANGVSLYQFFRLRADLHDVPVLFLTANPQLVRQAALAGRYACLAKPFDIQELVVHVQELLALSATAREASA